MAGALVYVRLVQACEDDGVLWEHPADAGFRDLVRAARRRMFQVHFADGCGVPTYTKYQISDSILSYYRMCERVFLGRTIGSTAASWR